MNNIKNLFFMGLMIASNQTIVTSEPNTQAIPSTPQTLGLNHSDATISPKSFLNFWYATCAVTAVGTTLLNKWLLKRGEKHVNTFNTKKLQALLKKALHGTITKEELKELASQLKAFFNDKIIGYRVNQRMNVKVKVPVENGQVAEIKDAVIKDVQARPSEGLGYAIDFLDELVDKDNILVKVAMFMVFVKGLENVIANGDVKPAADSKLK